MADGDVFDEVRLFLPKYLSPDRQQDLWRELRQFPSNRSIYTDRIEEPELLQGDGWKGFVVIDFHSSDRKSVSGLILSNSCDISLDNRRPISPSITFAPLINLERYFEMLRDTGQTQQQVLSIVETIRKQQVTSLMYLPPITGSLPESVALFGDLRSHPAADFIASDRSRLLRLSDFGFYLFLFKLSIHFNRMMEHVVR